MKRSYVLVSLIGFGLIAIGLGCNKGKPNYSQLSEKPIDLGRYAGKWYDLAHYPNRFQKNCTQTTATYEPKDGFIQVYNYCYNDKKDKVEDITGKAFVQDYPQNKRLKVQFFWPFKGDYWILYVDDNYELALVGHPERTYFWVLSRKPEINDERWQEVYALMEEKGYDKNQLEYTEHDIE